jgi:Domain of Unknown Function (DUF748)
MGVSPEFDSGALSLRLEIDGVGGANPLPSEVRLQDVLFSEGETTLFEMSSLGVQGLESTETGTKIGVVEIQGPTLKIERDKQGALHLAGVRLGGQLADAGPSAPVGTQPGSKKSSSETGKSTGKPTGKSSDQADRGKPVADKPAREHFGSGPKEDSFFTLQSLKLRGAKLDIVDHFLPKESRIPIDLTLDLSDLSLDQKGPSLHWDLAISIRDNLEQLRVRGDLSKSKGLDLGLDVAAKGIRGGILSAYLPEGISFGMDKGELLGRAHLQMEDGADGGPQVRAELEGWRLSDAGKDLWKLDKFVFHASCENVESQIYKIKELTTTGHEIHVVRDAKKRLRGLGLTLEPSVGEELPTQDSEMLKAQNLQKGKDRMTRLRSLRTPLEGLAAVHLGKVALGFDKIGFLDESDSGSAPVVGHLRIMNPKPIDLIPSDFDDLPEQVIQIDASLLPIVRSLKLELSAQPWNIIPEISASLRVEGIRGEGLTEVLPDLSKLIHGRDLSDGTLAVDLRLALRMRRASRMEFPLENGFGMNFELTDFEFRDKPGGRILAGLDSLEVHLRRFEARTGHVWIRSISAETPKARIDRTNEGIVLGGICFLLPESKPVKADTATKVETVPASDVQVQEGAQAGARAQKDAEPQKEDAYQPSMRLDHAALSGFDVVIRDLRASPPTVIPITGMEAEIKDFMRGVNHARHPTTFQVYIDGGLIDLPKRPQSKGLIRGLVSTASGVVDSTKPSVPTEKRAVFDELSIKGSILAGPTPTGQIKLNLTSLELLTFKSLAKRAGVLISDGVLDLSATADLGKDDRISVSLFPVFTYLSLSEPKDGFMSSMLALPAPLDTTLFLTRNSHGEHVYPLSFQLNRGEVSARQVRSIIVNALSQSLATMVTSSPFRLLGGVTSIVGIDINTRNTQVGEPIRLEFGPGQVTLTQKQKGQINLLITALKEDPNIDIRIAQRSGKEDWAYASRIANPSQEECRALARGLLQSRRELHRKRTSLAKRLLSLYENGRVEDAEKWGADLRRLDQKLGDLENAIEGVLEHLRPGAERQKGRRTKVANHEIAVHRIENVKAELLRVGGESFKGRVETLRPRSRMDGGLEGGEVILVQRRRVGR